MQELLGSLEIIASAHGMAPDDAKAAEFAAIEHLDRVIAAGMERRIFEYPEIALDLVGGMQAIQNAPPGLAFIDQRFNITSHSGIPIGQPGQVQFASTSRIFLEIDDPNGGSPLAISLEDIVFRSGSTIRSGSLTLNALGSPPQASGLAKVSTFLLGVIVTTIIQGAANSPISVSLTDGLLNGARERIVEAQAEVSQSPCAVKLKYRANVGLMRQGNADTYDYMATNDPAEKRLRICNIQVALRVLGYNAFGEIDGDFGPKTMAAWNRWREKQELNGPVEDRDYFELANAFRNRVEERLNDP